MKMVQEKKLFDGEMKLRIFIAKLLAIQEKNYG